MMQVRCQRCGWMYTLGRDAIGYAVAESEQARAEYYQEDCPKCRNVIKIQLKELRRRLPPDYVLPVLPPKPAPIQVKKDEEPKVAAPAKPAPPVQPEAAPAPRTRLASKPKSAPKSASRAKAAPKLKTAPKSKTTSKPKAKKK